MFRSITVSILSCFILSTPPLHAASHQDHPPAETREHGISLSPELAHLLDREMNAIENGMRDLIPAIAAGEWEKIATLGKNIKASFILKQKLTARQKEELHQALPPRFVEMDREFHAAAGMLAHAAEQGNADVVGFYFFKLTSACVECHAKFAAERFPGLATGTGSTGHHH